MTDRHPLRFALAALAALVLAAPAHAAISDWSNGSKAKMRLLAAGVGDDGRLSAAIEITLPRGWETYWRFPGDAGIAPVIDFSASRNLAGKPEVFFPVPRRYNDGFSITNIYLDRVVLPVSAAVADAKSAVDLIVSIDLGVCETVCIPDHVEARLLVPAGRTDAVAGKTIADAKALLPGPAQPGAFAVDKVTRTGGTDKRPVFQVAITAPDAAKAEVFVEGPADWYPDTPKAIMPAAGSKATFRITIAAGNKSVEQIVPLQ